MTGRRLRVLVGHNRYRSGQPSGEDRVVDQEVVLLRDAGHHVAVFERSSDEISSMSVAGKARAAGQSFWSRPARLDFLARLHAERPDVVHLHNTFPLLSPSVIAAAATVRVPVVATLHHYRQVCPSGVLYREGRVCDDCVGRLPWPSIRHGCYGGSRLATLPLAVGMASSRRVWWSGIERFFCISQAQRNTLVQAGMPAERLAVKHNFVADPGLRRLGSGSHVLYLGRLNEEKGLRLLMTAWERMTASGAAPVPLVIAGGGPMRGEIEQWAAGRDDVRFLGLLTRDECRVVTADAAVVVAPSVWPETFGLVVVEAMASGVPVVAAAHGAFVELVADGETGLLHSPGDPASLASCMAAALDPALGRRLGAAGRRRYEEAFTPETGLARLVEGYLAAIEGRPGGTT